MTPGDFSTIRSRIESSSFLSAPEKNEWLLALPHMTAEHIKELDRILAIKAPGVATSDKRLATGAEKAEPNPKSPIPGRPPASSAGVSPLQAPVGTIIESKIPAVRKAESDPADAAELRSITLEKMRQAGSIYTFLEDLAHKASEARKRTHTSVDTLIMAFEHSPLYRAYLESGLNIMKKQDGPLTRSEFEAMADFRTNLRSKLG